MTLTTRLNLFFLMALAVVLFGFSAVLYSLARVYLLRQDEERLTAALNTLVAAAEVGPEGIVWDPAERRLNLGGTALAGQVAWFIADRQGKLIDQSREEEGAAFVSALQDAGDFHAASNLEVTYRGEPWQLRYQTIEAPMAPQPSDATQPPGPKDEEPKYRAVSIAAAMSVARTQAALRNLAAALGGLSLGVWAVAFVAGRAVCRRALRPVSSMANAASQIDASELAQRLPVLASGDELENLGRSFNGLIDRLQESFERQRRFTGDASHQLRTPLAAMLGQIEVALRRERTADEYKQALATVQETAGRLRRIVEALLFLARADAEAALPQRERIELSSWLHQHLQTWSEHPRFGDIKLGHDSGEACYVSAHPVLLGELVNILLDNACKYSPPGTPITLRLNCSTDTICLDIEDQGPGLADADLSRLFTPFFRSDEARRPGIDGVGLGLSIARRLAEASGGMLTATSRLGQGSRFTLRLIAAGNPSQCPPSDEDKKKPRARLQPQVTD